MQLSFLLAAALVLLPIAGMAQVPPDYSADAKNRQQSGIWLYESGKFELALAEALAAAAAKEKYWAEYVKGLSPPPPPEKQ